MNPIITISDNALPYFGSLYSTLVLLLVLSRYLGKYTIGIRTTVDRAYPMTGQNASIGLFLDKTKETHDVSSKLLGY